jgi:hypothetical protein
MRDVELDLAAGVAELLSSKVASDGILATLADVSSAAYPEAHDDGFGRTSRGSRVVGSAPETARPHEFRAVVGVLDYAVRDLQSARRDVRRRAETLFRLGVLLVIAGAAVLAIGASLAATTSVGVGTTSAAVGALGAFIGTVFVRSYTTEMKMFDRLVRELHVIEQTRIGLLLANELSTAEQRDAAISRLIDRLPARGHGARTD